MQLNRATRLSRVERLREGGYPVGMTLPYVRKFFRELGLGEGGYPVGMTHPKVYKVWLVLAFWMWFGLSDYLDQGGTLVVASPTKAPWWLLCPPR